MNHKELIEQENLISDSKKLVIDKSCSNCKNYLNNNYTDCEKVLTEINIYADGYISCRIENENTFSCSEYERKG